MKMYLPKKAQDIKGNVAIAELKRAHLVIAILATAFAAILSFGSANEFRFDPALGAAAVMLLLLVAFVSLGTVYALRKR